MNKFNMEPMAIVNNILEPRRPGDVSTYNSSSTISGMSHGFDEINPVPLVLGPASKIIYNVVKKEMAINRDVQTEKWQATEVKSQANVNELIDWRKVMSTLSVKSQSGQRCHMEITSVSRIQCTPAVSETFQTHVQPTETRPEPKAEEDKEIRTQGKVQRKYINIQPKPSENFNSNSKIVIPTGVTKGSKSVTPAVVNLPDTENRAESIKYVLCGQNERINHRDDQFVETKQVEIKIKSKVESSENLAIYSNKKYHIIAPNDCVKSDMTNSASLTSKVEMLKRDNGSNSLITDNAPRNQRDSTIAIKQGNDCIQPHSFSYPSPGEIIKVSNSIQNFVCSSSLTSLNSKDVYKSVQSSGEVIETDEHRLPGTDLEYRTPGANNINKNGKIKRPMNAFMVWARAYRAKLAQEFPDSTNSEVSVRLGQVWSEMTQDQKQPYYLEAERIKQRHRLQYPEWSYTPTPTRRRPGDDGNHVVTLPGYVAGTSPSEALIISDLTSGSSVLHNTLTIQDNGYRDDCQKAIGSLLYNVYQPVDVKRPELECILTECPVPVKQEKDKMPHDEKVNYGQTSLEKTSNQSALGSSSTLAKEASCPMATNQKKRPRRPKVKRKDSNNNDEDAIRSGAIQPKTKRKNKSRSKNSLGGQLRGLCPEDPYNPFYLLNLGQVEEDGPEDLDIDRWNTYLEANNGIVGDASMEPAYNLDVFLSEARVSSSTTSIASSDIEILPTPVASTLDRLQRPLASKDKSSGHYRDPKRHTSINHVTVELQNNPNELSKQDVSPAGDELFVVKEEVVETTPLMITSEQDRGGCGDSVTYKHNNNGGVNNFIHGIRFSD